MKIKLTEEQLRKLIRGELQKIIKEDGLATAFNTVDDLQQNFIKTFNEIVGKKWARKIKMLKFEKNTYSFILIGDGNERFKLEWNFSLPKEKHGLFKISPLKKLRVGDEFSESLYSLLDAVISSKAKFEPILKEISDLMEKGGMVDDSKPETEPEEEPTEEPAEEPETEPEEKPEEEPEEEPEEKPEEEPEEKPEEEPEEKPEEEPEEEKKEDKKEVKEESKKKPKTPLIKENLSLVENITSILLNSDTSSDKDLKKCFMEKLKLNEEESNFYLSQKKKALKEGLNFKLTTFKEDFTAPSWVKKIIEGYDKVNKRNVFILIGENGQYEVKIHRISNKNSIFPSAVVHGLKTENLFEKNKKLDEAISKFEKQSKNLKEISEILGYEMNLRKK